MKRVLLVFSLSALITGCGGVEKRAPLPEPYSAAKDAQISQLVRQAILNREDMSVNAHNVFIRSQNGVVVLRGAVDSPTERAGVVQTAREVAGVRGIKDEMETLVSDVTAKRSNVTE